MRLIKRETKYKLLVIALLLGSLFGLVFFLTDTKYEFVLFYLFAFLLPIALIWLKIQGYYYRKVAYGAPVVSVSEENLETIINFLKKNSFNSVADLGSGYGNICLKAAEEGISVTGYEINPFPYLISKMRAMLNKELKNKQVDLKFKNIWEADLSKHDCIIVYGISYVMKDLKDKLLKELSKNSVIISVYFEFPELESFHKEKEVIFYRI